VLVRPKAPRAPGKLPGSALGTSLGKLLEKLLGALAGLVPWKLTGERCWVRLPWSFARDLIFPLKPNTFFICFGPLEVSNCS